MSEKSGSLDDIFFEAIAIVSLEERASFLEQACGNDREVRRQVERMIEVQRKLGSFLEAPPWLESTTLGDGSKVASKTTSLGQSIGPYELLEMIGEGGMGIVFRAQQTDPMRRQVAVKVIKPGMDSRQVLARFAAERQALALMEHPGIARVLEAGATARGRPYFVMEYVAGIPIDQYCDDRRLSLRERLKLFATVCRAAQHAHQKGVIHRDLKPSHVLVTDYEGGPAPKIIDFGIAKAVAGQQLSDQTIYTAYGQLVGTPLYMSPEQAEYGGSSVDARSDIYALGGILYKLLTGCTPIDKDKAATDSFEEVLRLIREVDPPRPSARVRSGSDGKMAITCRDATTPEQLSKLLHNELDWIVMKALAKDRGQRYQSAGAFADDIEHYLKDEPVAARPPSLGNRTRRWARHHRTLVWATGAALATATLVVIAGAWILLAEHRKGSGAHKLATERGIALRDHRLAAELSQAWRDWEAGEVFQAQATLARQAPLPGQPNTRGFAWNYLRALCQGAYQELTGHQGDVYGVAFSPDGNTLASCGQDRTIVLWNLATGKLKAKLTGHSDDVDAVAFAPDGGMLVSGGADRTVRIWNAADGKRIGTLSGFQLGIDQVLIHPDGKTLIASETSFEGKRIAETSVWNIPSGRKLRTLKGQRALALSPDGRFLATACPDAAVRLLDYASLRPLTEARGHADYPTSGAFSPDGRLLATGSHRSTLWLWQVPGLQPVAELTGHRFQVRGIAFSPDGRTLASVGDDGQMLIWDVATRTLRSSSTAHRSVAWAAAFSPDGRTLATAYRDSMIRLWPVTRSLNRKSLSQHPGSVRSIAILPGSKSFATVCGDSRCRIWDIETGQPLGEMQSPGKQLDQLAASPTEPLLAMVDSVGGLSVREWPSGTQRHGFRVDPDRGPPCHSLAFLPGGRELATIDGNAVVTFWNVRSGQPRLRVPLPADEARSGLRWITPAPTGDLLATWRATILELIDTISGSVRQLPTTAQHSLTCVTWSPDGKQIATSDEDRQIRLYDRNGRELAVLTGHKSWPTVLAFSPDGRTLVSGSDTGEVFLWCTASGQLLYPLRGHGGCVLDLAFSTDGTRLITAGATQKAKPWVNTQAWWERHVLQGGGNEQAVRGEVFIWHAPRAKP